MARPFYTIMMNLQALNATGRPMAFELCRGPYEKMQDWGYADSVAQLWRADGDHHDSFSHTLEQLAARKSSTLEHAAV